MITFCQPIKRAFAISLAVLFLFPPLMNSHALLAAQQERTYQVYEPNMPKGVFEITQVKNLQSPAFPRDFEVEVKNISNKPIYYLDIDIVLPESGTPPYGFHLCYGRHEIANFKLAEDRDVPLLPGESVVLVEEHPLRQNMLLWFKDNDAEWARATSRVRLVFQSLHFGDGTGYVINQPYPAKK